MAEPLVPPHIEGIVAYVPGKPAEALERESGHPARATLKLASNENPLGPSPRALAAIAAAAPTVHLYPDGDAYALRAALAARHGVGADEIVVGAGTNELIDLIVRTFCGAGDQVLLSAGSFVCYELAARAAGVPFVAVPLRDLGYDLDAMADALTPRTKVVFVANPNNPTGSYVGRAALERFCARLPPRALLVLDEAYFEYADAPDYPDSLALRDRHARLVTLRTFSKIHGLAGLRVGYAVARPELCRYLHRVRAPFNVGSLAQAAALAALDDVEHVRRSAEVNRAERARLAAALTALGARVAPSQANFLLAAFPRPADQVHRALEARGVIVRPVANYGLPDHLRITVGAPEHDDRLLAALREALA